MKLLQRNRYLDIWLLQIMDYLLPLTIDLRTRFYGCKSILLDAINFVTGPLLCISFTLDIKNFLFFAHGYFIHNIVKFFHENESDE